MNDETKSLVAAQLASAIIISSGPYEQKEAVQTAISLYFQCLDSLKAPPLPPIEEAVLIKARTRGRD
jgi:hypothetical protein